MKELCFITVFQFYTAVWCRLDWTVCCVVVCVCACVDIIQPNDTKVFLFVDGCHLHCHKHSTIQECPHCTEEISEWESHQWGHHSRVSPAWRGVLWSSIWEGKKGDVTSCQKTCCCDILLDSRCRGEMRIEHPPCITWGSFWDDLGLLCRYRFPWAVQLFYCIRGCCKGHTRIQHWQWGCVFDTDNAAHMKKAFTAALQLLFPNSLHITCRAHSESYWQYLSQTFCSIEQLHAEFLPDVPECWIMREKIPLLPDKQATKKKGSHASKPLRSTLELLVLSNALPC